MKNPCLIADIDCSINVETAKVIEISNAPEIERPKLLNTLKDIGFQYLIWKILDSLFDSFMNIIQIIIENSNN